MNKYIKLRKLNTVLIIFIAGYQLIAALLGFYALFIGILSNGLIQNIQNLIFIFPVLLFSLLTSVALFIYLDNPSRVIIYTYISQALQVLQLKFAGYGVYIVLGTCFHFGYLNNGDISFFYDFEPIAANVSINLFSNLEGQMLLINLVPLFLIYLSHYATRISKIQNQEL